MADKDTIVDSSLTGPEAGDTANTVVERRDPARSPGLRLEGASFIPSLPSPKLALSGDERYGEQAEIGKGGMGRVFRVHDHNLNREVAMKVLRKDLANNDLVRRFHVEAQIGGQLEHPGLLPIHDLGHDDDGNAFFTMRYVAEHETLSAIISRLRDGDESTHALYTMERRIHIIQRVVNALSYAHQRGVVHRDIKPDNILIGANGEVYLADWGVATLIKSKTDETVETSIEERPLPEGSLVGTLLYMSPEQLLGEHNVGPRSDVYGLCAVTYEFFCLHHYLGETPPSTHVSILDSVIYGDRVDAESYLHPQNLRVPRQLSRILRWGLQKDREAAFTSADELSAALQAWVEGKAPIVCPGTFIQRMLTHWGRAIDRRPVLVPVLSLSLVAMALACVAFTLVQVGTTAL